MHAHDAPCRRRPMAMQPGMMPAGRRAHEPWHVTRQGSVTEAEPPSRRRAHGMRAGALHAALLPRRIGII